jgi:hypothetical protein
MTTKDTPALALEALELASITVDNFTVQAKCQEAITAIKQAITPETGNAATPEASAITAGNGQAQEPVGINGLTEAETNASMSVMGLSKAAPKQAEPASCHQTGVCVRSGLAAENHARVIECARRLVEHADFALGGILSADSKAKDIPSKAVSQVKSRHLAALRDALPTPPEAA